MSDWTAGYRTDTEYVHAYHGELNPLRARVALTNAGIACPAFHTAFELGYGQGLSVNMHAAGSPVAWYGNDFNALQAANAQELAAASGAGAQLTEESFAELAKRRDLPDFDYIGLHGIWSWVSSSNRKLVTDFIRRKLKPGGVVYLGYNTTAGFASFEPVRQLLLQHSRVMGVKGRGILPRVGDAVEFAERLFALNPPFVRLNPVASESVKTLRRKSKHYLAHEYFNLDWQPMHFAEIAEQLHGAKLEYGCSAHYMDHIGNSNFTIEQQRFLQEIPDTVFRESVKELMLHQRFRKDFWVKGARRLTTGERRQRLRRLRFVMTALRTEIPQTVKGVMGEARIDTESFRIVLDQLQDHSVLTLGEIEKSAAGSPISLSELMDALLVLSGLGVVQPAHEEVVAKKTRAQCAALNLHLLQQSLSRADCAYLASPITGGGIPVNHVQQLFLLARHEGHKKPGQWAAFARQALAGLEQKLVVKDKVLEDPTEQLDALDRVANDFARAKLPTLRKLLVVD